jgi:CheY-like chemotaxis protein
VESTFGSGSTFTIRLPADVAASPVDHAESPQPESDDGQRRRSVLVVDDEESVRDLLRRTFAREGLRVMAAAGGEEGVRLAREQRPDVITLDVMMPIMDGWAVLSALKADPATRDIPVVMVSIVDDKNLGYSLGASEYLTKPVDRDRLTRIVRSLIAGPHARILLVEDDESTRAMLRRTLEPEAWTVAEAANGREALELIAESTPSAIVLDLMMPEMDGFELVAALREHPEWRAIPVIVLTAKDLTPQDRRRLNGGVEAYIQKKAMSREDLLAEIRDVVVDTVRIDHHSV